MTNQPDTSMGGPRGDFPETCASVIQRMRSPDPQVARAALEVLIAAYWKPVYKALRIRFRRSNDDAKDLTQAFFAAMMERDFIAEYDPARGRFRTYVLVCLQSFVGKDGRAGRALKRGGGVAHVPLEFDAVEAELGRDEPAADETLEQYFEQEWVRGLVGAALDELREDCVARGKETHFRIFELYDLAEPGPDRPTYEQLAARFGLSFADVSNALIYARRRFRESVVETLRKVTATPEEFAEERRAILGSETT